MQVFDVLYSSLEASSYFLSEATKARIRREAEIDQLIESHILERYERALRDLSPAQTEALVERLLATDDHGRSVVLGILQRVFRRETEESEVSLSGKPVIITYLLEVVEQLKTAPQAAFDGKLTEWQLYKLIIDQLMLRDLERSPRISPDRRRAFLHSLAVWLSQKDHSSVGEDDLADLVAREFRSELRRLPSESRAPALQQYVDDLRGSTTLTRAYEPGSSGWRFSHNSLREFLLAEYLTVSLEAGVVPSERVPISDSMRTFVASRVGQELLDLEMQLARHWGERHSTPGIGQLLCLMWNGLAQLPERDGEDPGAALKRITGERIALDTAVLSRIALSDWDRPADLEGATLAGSDLSDVSLASGNFRSADFSNSVLENCDLSGADLEGASFRGAFLFDVDLRGANVAGADFRGIELDSSVIVSAAASEEAAVLVDGPAARGYLRYHGAKTDPVDTYSVYVNHPAFPIVEKIVSKLREQSQRQRRGLVQRGVARKDRAFAETLLMRFEKEGLVVTPLGRGTMIESTPRGRSVFAELLDGHVLPAIIEDVLTKAN